MPNRKNSRLSWNKGSYILEFGLLSLGIVFLTAGVWDFVAITHARNSLDAALQHGLRCAYPVDAACTLPGVAPITASDDIRYDAWVTLTDQDLDDKYTTILEEGTASASGYREFFTEVIENTQTIQTVSASVHDSSYAEYPKLYPVRAKKLSLSLTDPLPFISGESTAPSFRIRRPDDTNGTRPGSQAVPFLSKSLSRVVILPGAREGESDEYLLPPGYLLPNHDEMFEVLSANSLSLETSLPCLNTDSTGKETACDGVENFGGAGKHQASDLTDICIDKDEISVLRFVHALIHVSGDVIPGRSQFGDKVTMSLKVSGCGEERKLGGRLLESTSSGNFMVRGARETLLHGSGRDTYYAEEFKRYQHVLIPVGRPFKLKFHLESQSSSGIGWRGREVRIFVPRYRFQSEDLSCKNQVRYAATEIPCNPEIATKKRIVSPTADYEHAVVGTQALAAKCSRDPVTEETHDTVWLEDPAGMVHCPQSQIEWGCLGNAYAKWYDGCDKTDPAATELESICPPPAQVKKKMDLGFAGAPGILQSSQNIRREATTVNLTACNEEKILPSCAVQSPAQARYSRSGPCAAGQILPVHFSTGPMLKNTCEPNAPQVEAANFLKASGLLEQAGDLYTIQTSRKEIGKKVWIDEPPKGACMDIEKIQANDSRRVSEYLCESGATKAQAERCCAFASGKCRLEIVKNRGQLPSGSTEAQLNLAHAESIAKASLKGLSLGGSGADDKNYSEAIEFTLEENGLDGEKDLVKASGTIQVPVILASYFSGDENGAVTVVREVSKRLERGLVLQNR